MQYQAPYKDMQLLVSQVYKQQNLDQVAALSDFDIELANAVMDEAAKFASTVLAPLNQVGDVQGCSFKEGRVITPEGWKEAYQRFVESGWLGLALPEKYGGQGLPRYIAQPVNEMWLSANLAFVMFQAMAQGGSEILMKYASESIQSRYLTKIVTGEWAVAMSLTEPSAGSDLGALKTKAIAQDDGTYRIQGQKIFITYGEHDLTDNIVHLVLARASDSPEGSRGLSLFVVPKYRVAEDGRLGDFNDLRCTGIEHKLGLHGSPTCSISYGDNNECIGELVGGLNQGLMAMFVLMNEARLSCGLQGVALGELGYQNALQYAHERVQGSAGGSQSVTIIEHADVQRMLLEMRSETFALRALGYQIAAQIDVLEQTSNKHLADRIGLLTPIFKAFSTERANSMAGTVVQIYGGMGFIEETGVSQIMRDARVTTIYEGTTGIQAKDFLFRKVRGDNGAALSALLMEIESLANSLYKDNQLGQTAVQVGALVQTVRELMSSELLGERQGIALQRGSVPLLMAIGTLCCAWQLLNATSQALRSCTDKDYCQNLIAMTQFYGAFRLPYAEAALKTVALTADENIDYNFSVS